MVPELPPKNKTPSPDMSSCTDVSNLNLDSFFPLTAYFTNIFQLTRQLLTITQKNPNYLVILFPLYIFPPTVNLTVRVNPTKR